MPVPLTSELSLQSHTELSCQLMCYVFIWSNILSIDGHKSKYQSTLKIFILCIAGSAKI